MVSDSMSPNHTRRFGENPSPVSSSIATSPPPFNCLHKLKRFRFILIGNNLLLLYWQIPFAQIETESFLPDLWLIISVQHFPLRNSQHSFLSLEILPVNCKPQLALT